MPAPLLKKVLELVFLRGGKLLFGVLACAGAIVTLPLWIFPAILYTVGGTALEIKDELALRLRLWRQEHRRPTSSEQVHASDWRKQDKGFLVHLKRLGAGVVFAPLAVVSAPIWVPFVFCSMAYEVGTDLITGAVRRLKLKAGS